MHGYRGSRAVGFTSLVSVVAGLLVGCGGESERSGPGALGESEVCVKDPVEAGWCYDDALEEKWPAKGDIDIVFGILSERRVGEPVDLKITVTNRTDSVCRYGFEVGSNQFLEPGQRKFEVTVEGELVPGASKELVERTPVIGEASPLFSVEYVDRRCRPVG